MAKKGSKNDINNRGSGARLRELNGKKVRPGKYIGAALGHGNYMAAIYFEGAEAGKFAVDASGKPIPYSNIPS